MRRPRTKRSARTAVVRWGWRLFRREWRQQALVIALLAVAVAAATGLSIAASVLAPVGANAEFGQASHRLTLDEVDPAEIEATIDAAEQWFEQIEIIGRQQAPLPGFSDPVEIRAQDPAGPLSGPMLSLRAGRFPTSPSEVTLAEPLATQLGVETGESLELGGGPVTVVGLVENPSALDDTFVLISPEVATGFGSVTILVDDSADRALTFRAPGETSPVISSRSAGEGVVAAITVLAISELSLVLVSLIAAAGFVAVAQRRLRQLGMLAAIGAPSGLLRLVMVTNGALVGLAATITGTAAGLALWFAGAPLLGRTAGLRIDRLAVPWWLVAAIALLTVATTTTAAWWPARLMSRIPITEALSGRRPRPRVARRSIVLAGGLIIGGALAVASAGDVADETANGFAVTNTLLLASGTVGIVGGTLLLSPLVVATLASVPTRAPLPIRVALRDLARYQSRSAAALAAISLALGVPMAVIIGVSAAEDDRDEGNLSSHHLLVTADDLTAPFVTDRSADRQLALADAVMALADEVEGQAVLELQKVVDPAREINEFGRPTVRVSRPDEVSDGAPVFLASPELLDLYGDPSVAPGTELITSEASGFALAGAVDPETGQRTPQEVTEVAMVEPVYSSLPTTMMTTEGAARRGWEARPAGWLIVAAEPLTNEQVTVARERAIATGLSIEGRDDQRGLLRLRTAATGLAVALALAILAMTVGLVRSESSRDLQTLTATGATSGIRRAITAATAGGLALLGVVLGTVGAYLGLVAGSAGDTSAVFPIPAAHLLAVVVGVPLMAAIAGWLVSGREPETLARQPIG